jgi:hypothetical protein
MVGTKFEEGFANLKRVVARRYRDIRKQARRLGVRREGY